MVAPQLLHFVVRNLTYTPTCIGVLVTCYTNNPCHLWLRYTTTPTQKHVKTKMVRGAPAGTYIDQCFVVFTDVEQNEPGDTYTHTFTLDPWPHCQTRWFYFWGTVDGQLSPSASCIFQKHRSEPSSQGDYQLLHDAWHGFCQYWAAQGQSITPIRTYKATAIVLILAQHDTTRRGTFEVRLQLAGGNCWEEPILAAYHGYSTELQVNPSMNPVTFPIAPTILTAGITYRIVPVCTPTWQWWNVDHWQDADWIQALDFRRYVAANAYPRGTLGGTCDIKNSGGAYTPSLIEDFYFCVLGTPV